MPSFGTEEIRKAISEALNTDVTIPAGHKGAIVTMATENGLEMAVATKFNNNWSVELIGKHGWSGGNEIGLVSKITW